ncbi:tetratricopeptide repeat protein [Geomonas sp. Red69]|uniref:tetratricopeptide repeat protein n=1 Tax=Geomonas diazotrophica TaxID=2843197 RepID=UPI001C0F4711|nr:tetratricopeptide repeat protein [Geomonas diazotrophica]MBU5637903.1 tetratricopeptide repeat protein [Geomonas diazotrophica]
MSTEFRKNVFIFVSFTIIALAAYANTFHVPFQFDDDAYVVNNPIIRDFRSFLSPHQITAGTSLSPEGIPPALRFAFMTRMLGYLSLAVNYHLHGLEVFGYHAVNLTLHILNAFLVYLVLSRALGGRREQDAPRGAAFSQVALFASLIFLCHPIQTHAVTYVTSRFVLLAAFFSLCSLYSYTTSRHAVTGKKSTVLLVVSVVSAALAMLCKEFTFTLPFLILLFEYTFYPGSISTHIKKAAPLALTLPIIPALVFLQRGQLGAVDSTMRTITAADSSGISRMDYLLTQSRVIVRYLELLLFPVGQNVDHDFAIQHSISSPAVAVSLLLIAALLALAATGLLRRKAAPPVIAFGLAWFFIGLSIESSIIPLGEISAEYRVYLPSIGIILIFAHGAKTIAERLSLGKVSSGLLAAAIILGLAVATGARNTVWQSEMSLWSDAAKKSPGKVRPHQNLALYYARAGNLEGARQELQKAISINPNDFELHNNLGVVLKQQGKNDEAIREYQTVLTLQPGDVMARFNLGNVYLVQKRYDKALELYRSCLQSIPEYDELHNNLGIVYGKLGQREQSIKAFEEALRLNPSNINAKRNLDLARKVTTPPPAGR